MRSFFQVVVAAAQTLARLLVSDTTDRDRPDIKNTLMMICTITLEKKNKGKRKNSEDLLENSCKVESQMKNLQKKTNKYKQQKINILRVGQNKTRTE